MEHRPLLSPATWARDFAAIGLAMGTLAPLFVIFDPGYALVAGLAGGASGAVVGAASATVLERLRGRVPLAVLTPAMAAVGSLWGAFAGTIGGMGSLWIGLDAVFPGFVLGATTGMVALGLGFLPYLVLSVRGYSTLPLVGLSFLVAPAMGWAGFAALVASTFGLWLFLLPFLAVGGVLLDRSERAVRRAQLARRDASLREKAMATGLVGGRHLEPPCATPSPSSPSSPWRVPALAPSVSIAPASPST